MSVQDITSGDHSGENKVEAWDKERGELTARIGELDKIVAEYSFGLMKERGDHQKAE